MAASSAIRIHPRHRAQAMRFLARDCRTRDLAVLMQLAELAREYGTKAPQVRLVVRSHRHRFIHVDTGEVQAVTTPSWQLRTAYSYRRGGVMLPHIGWLLVTIEDGEIWARPRRYKLPLPRIEGGG